MAATVSEALTTSPNSNTNNFPLTIAISSQETMIEKGTAIDEGHSVDAPDIIQWEKPDMKLFEVDSSVNHLTKVLSRCSSSLALEQAEREYKENSDGNSSVKGFGDVEKKDVSTNSQEKDPTGPDPDDSGRVSLSSSVFLPSEISADSVINKPNVYWLNTEFARLVSDKKKLSKTTNEMRKELKDIGLGDVVSSSSRHKSVEDIMREYGLEPSVSTSSFIPMGPAKNAWTSKHRYGITNMSQNNEMLLGSEVDDQKATGSSVDGDIGFLLKQRPSSNSSYVSLSTPKENKIIYSESRNFSRTPSFSFYDFKNNISSTNLQSKVGSATDLDDRSLNPSVYFQRERERLQRLDSVISKTPKSSFTDIPTQNPMDFTDGTFSYRRPLTSRRPSFLESDQGLPSGGFGEEEKKRGSFSPTRAYYQRQPSFTGKSYNNARFFSPNAILSQYTSHENPIYMDSSSFSPTYSRTSYSRNTSSPENKQTFSTPARKQQSPTNSTTKAQSKQSERNSYKSTSRLATDSQSSRGYNKLAKSKPRQSKSSASTVGKTRYPGDVEKRYQAVKLMKNYSNSCVLADIDTALNNSAMKDCTYEPPAPRDVGPNKQTSKNPANGMEVNAKMGKYKPYQQSISSVEINLQDQPQSNLYNSKKSNLYNSKNSSSYHYNSKTPQSDLYNSKASQRYMQNAWDDSFQYDSFQSKKNFQKTDFNSDSMTPNTTEERASSLRGYENWKAFLNSSLPKDDDTFNKDEDQSNTYSKMSLGYEKPDEIDNHTSNCIHPNMTMEQGSKGKPKSKKNCKPTLKKKVTKRK